MGLTDDIREFVCKNYIQPARERGDKHITIRAGDVHSRMGLTSRMPAVCSALRSKLDRMCGVKVIDIRAPPSGQGANFYVTYEILSKGQEVTEEFPKIPSIRKPQLGKEVENIPQIIRELFRFKEDGIITEEEFEKKKKELLDRL